MYVGCSKSLTTNSRCQNGVSSQRFTTNKTCQKKGGNGSRSRGLSHHGEDFHTMMQVRHLWKGDRMSISQEEPQTSVSFGEVSASPIWSPRTKIPIDSHFGQNRPSVPVYSFCAPSLDDLLWRASSQHYPKGATAGGCWRTSLPIADRQFLSWRETVIPL